MKMMLQEDENLEHIQQNTVILFAKKMTPNLHCFMADMGYLMSNFYDFGDD